MSIDYKKSRVNGTIIKETIFTPGAAYIIGDTQMQGIARENVFNLTMRGVFPLVYLRKENKKWHVFKSYSANWTTRYTDTQLYGKKIIELSEEQLKCKI